MSDFRAILGAPAAIALPLLLVVWMLVRQGRRKRESPRGKMPPPEGG